MTNKTETSSRSETTNLLMRSLIKEMPQEDKDKLHSNMAKRFVDEFIENMVRNDAMFEQGGKLEAKVITGGGRLIYELTSVVRSATSEESEEWLDSQPDLSEDEIKEIRNEWAKDNSVEANQGDEW